MTRAEKRKEWETRIARYRASGQSVREWCAANNVKHERLWYWLRKAKTKIDTPPEQPIQWLPIEISEASSGDKPILLRTGECVYMALNKSYNLLVENDFDKLRKATGLWFLMPF